MAILDKIKKRLRDIGIMPDSIESGMNEANSVNDLRGVIDQQIEENTLLLEQNDKKIEELEYEIEDLKEDLKEIVQDQEKSNIRNAEKIRILRRIKLKNSSLESFQTRNKIYSDNIEMHFMILNKIDEMEAIENKAIIKEQIENISIDHEEAMEKHSDMMQTIYGAESPTYTTELEDIELKKLEQQILKENEEEPKEVRRQSLDSLIDDILEKEEQSLDKILEEES